MNLNGKIRYQLIQKLSKLKKFLYILNYILIFFESSVFAFLEDIVKATNMKCLTPDSAMQGNCRFLAANLYARSIFGEDALANMSVEQLETGEISGYIRIRSKTQGIALSLGDKIAQRCN